MAKKSGGLLALLTGVGIGLAAAFFSKEENRKRAASTAKKTVSQAKKLKSEYDKNPAKVTKQLKAKATKAVKTATKKAQKLASAAEKKVAKKPRVSKKS